MGQSSGLFTIQELPLEGAQPDLPPEMFVWAAGPNPPDPAKGGARAIPKQPWHLPGKQRTVRTDYPGARYPSEQILGPQHEPFTLTGRWDDRYNYDGYARDEKARFLGMCRRGNMVRITFGDEVCEGVITDWDFEIRRAWDIHYSFTVSNHGRPDEDQAAAVAPQPVQSPGQAFDRVLLATAAMLKTQTRAPASAITGDSKRTLDGVLSGMTQSLDKLSDQLDARTNSRALRPITTFKRLGTQFRMVEGAAFNVLTAMVGVRADVELGVRTAIAVLNFECWSRSMRGQARLTMGESHRAAKSMDRRASAGPMRAYRPYKGESLYHVSQRFYGTPFEWRLIASANGLRALTLDGTELLMIPIRGEG